MPPNNITRRQNWSDKLPNIIIFTLCAMSFTVPQTEKIKKFPELYSLDDTECDKNVSCLCNLL